MQFTKKKLSFSAPVQSYSEVWLHTSSPQDAPESTRYFFSDHSRQSPIIFIVLGLIRVVTYSEPIVLGYHLLTCTTHFLRLAFFVVTRLSQGSTTSRTFQARKRPRKDTVARAYYQRGKFWSSRWISVEDLVHYKCSGIRSVFYRVDGPFARQLTDPVHSLNRRLGFGPVRLSLPLQKNV